MSDNELDAELLGMVGGESDDEGEELDQTQHIQDRSPSEEAKESVEKIEEPPRRTKGVAQKVKGRRRQKKRQDSEEDDLGDGSPSPPESLNGDAEPAYDGDAAASPPLPADDAPLYPFENLYLSQAEKDEILAKPEIEREVILAERQAENTKRQQDASLKKALANASAAANKHKRKAAAAELEDGERRSTRPKAENKKTTALDEYKRKRELKGIERGRLDTDKDRRDERRSSSAGSDRDADGESEVEWAAEPSSDSRHHRDEPSAQLSDYERCRVGRSNFAKVCFYPGFEDAIKGCFARVSIGLNRETGQNMYRMTQIKGFTEGKPYTMEATNGKPFTTDQYAIVAHGKAEKPWPFSACSDSRFTSDEYSRYVTTLEKENIRVPSRKYLDARVDAINGLLNIRWSDELLSKKFANQRAMERKCDPRQALLVKREKILQRKAEAEQTHDEEEVARCDAELAALDNSTMNGSTVKISPAKKAITGEVKMTSQDRLAALNARNRGKNADSVRKALLEEKRKLQLAREQAIAEARAKREAEEAKKKAEEDAKLLAVPKVDMSELFGDASDISRAGTPGVGTPKRRSRAGTPLNGVKKEKSGLGQIKKKVMDDEIIGGLDLGIDVEI